MSNAITDILRATLSFKKAAIEKAYDEFGEVDLDKANKILDDYIDTALQALYEAVKGCAPPEQSTREGLDKLSKSDFHIVLSLRQGHNACRSEFLTNLSLLFGGTLADSSKQEEASDV